MGLRIRESLQRRGRLRALPAREGRPSVRQAVDRDGARSGVPAAQAGRGRRALLIRRLPIRVKVTLAFAGAMAVVLALVGIVLYTQFRAHLDDTLNQGLRSRAGDVSALIQRGDSGLAAPGRSVLVERGESFAQILDTNGNVLDGSPKLTATSLLTPARVAQAARRTLIFTRPN